MVEKSNLSSRAAHVEKTELWKDYPDYYRELEKQHLWPLWEEINKFTGVGRPSSKIVPCVWRYEDTRRLVMQSADLLTAEEIVEGDSPRETLDRLRTCSRPRRPSAAFWRSRIRGWRTGWRSLRACMRATSS